MSGGHDHDRARCREIFALLSEYLDDELDPALCERIESHNADCARCEAFLASLRATVELLRDQERPGLSPEARRRLAARFRESGDA